MESQSRRAVINRTYQVTFRKELALETEKNVIFCPASRQNEFLIRIFKFFYVETELGVSYENWCRYLFDLLGTMSTPDHLRILYCKNQPYPVIFTETF